MFRSPHGTHHSLILDIRSGSVGAALIQFSGAVPPTIVYSVRLEIPFQEKTDAAVLFSLMLRTLSSVMLRVSHEALGAHSGQKPIFLSKTFVILSALWTKSQTSFLHLEQKEEVKITEELFLRLLQEETSHQATEGVCIEQMLIKTKLRGYPTAHPFGREAEDAEFCVLQSFSPQDIVQKIHDTVTHALHPGSISFHSFSLSAWSVLREIFPEERNFLFADVSGELTELSIIKKGVAVERMTFPFGRNAVLRKLQKETSVPLNTASSFLKLQTEERGTGKLYEKGGAALVSIRAEWFSHFFHALAALSEELFLPHTVFLTADDDIRSFFSQAVREGDWRKLLPIPDSLKVIALESELLKSLVVFPQNQQDTLLSLEAVFIQELKNSSGGFTVDSRPITVHS